MPDARRIPEATVVRLPLYYRALLETADQEIGTVSSERLAELAGVNAAKVRKDLSYLGSYGTRGVGYDVEHLLHEISRELGLTHDWPVVDRRCRQPRPRARQLPRLRRPRLPHRGAGRRRPREGRPDASATSPSSRSTTCPTIVRDPGRRHRHHRHARARGAGGRRPPRRRRGHVDPQLRADGRDRARRACRCARSTSPSSCRSCPSTSSARDSRRPARAGEPRNGDAPGAR